MAALHGGGHLGKHVALLVAGSKGIILERRNVPRLCYCHVIRSPQSRPQEDRLEGHLSERRAHA
eukprot:2689128-Amphidinium_carterae.1